MTTRRYALPSSGPAVRSPTPPFRPRIVFSRDDAIAGGGPSPAVRILIVEDDYLVGSQMSDSLADAGFEIAAVATSCEEALSLARREKISFAIMDVRLAGKRDGVDCALELFKTYGIRCIFATAHADPQIKARAEPAKPLGWVQKPYSMASLIANVRKTLNTRD